MKKVKYVLCVFLIASLMLTLFACQDASSTGENEMLEYPGVSWEATPEEVIQAMGFPAGAVQSSSDEDGYYMGVEDWDCFGVPAQSIAFRFHTDESGRNWLRSIDIVYPEDADMDAVRQAMEAEYGESVSTYVTANVDYSWDETNTADADASPVTQEMATVGEGTLCWLSPTAADYFSDDVRQAAYGEYGPSYQEVLGRGLTEEEFSRIWESNYLVQVFCTENAYEGMDIAFSSRTSNVVMFNASYLELYRVYEDAQLFSTEVYQNLARSS